MMTTPAAVPEMTPVPVAAEAVPKPGVRLVSLDALRGFDMFWIIGAEEVVNAVAKVFPNHWTKLAATQNQHVEWAGFHFEDLIFPMFVFIVGVSLVFSLSKAIATRSKAVAVRRVILRGL